MPRQLSPDGSRRMPAKRLLLLALGGLALFLGWRPPLASAQPVAPAGKTTFLVIYRPGPAWVPRWRAPCRPRYDRAQRRHDARVTPRWPSRSGSP
jgi:hypothetical protein